MLEFTGRAICLGDDINTDYIISSRRKKDTINPEELVPYLMEDIRPGFNDMLKGSCILVAGQNFGCGSAMEVAAQVVKSAGITMILAKSFARSYFRNAINNGIMPVEIDTSDIREGDMIRIAQSGDFIEVVDLRSMKAIRRAGFQGKIREILECGGLVPYMTRVIEDERRVH